MLENGIYKGGVLIINLDSIKMIGSDYIFQEGDKVRIALKKTEESTENILYSEIIPTVGESKVQTTFTGEETNQKLEYGETYILQADLISSKGPLPMLLQKLNVIGQAIIPNEK